MHGLTADTAAFPKLTDDQLSQLCQLAERRQLTSGDALFRAGDKDFDFFAILDGEVEIVDDSSGERTRVVVHGPREFTGDVSLLTGRPAVVSAFVGK